MPASAEDHVGDHEGGKEDATEDVTEDAAGDVTGDVADDAAEAAQPDTRLAMRKDAPERGRGDGKADREPPSHWLYLHGFASSPRSRKAQFFRGRCASAGLPLLVPDLNVPSFSELTMTAMLDTIGSTIAGLPDDATVGIIGADLGGLLAILTATQKRSVKRLLLLAPVTQLFRKYYLGLGRVGVRKWEQAGHAVFEHHGIGGKVRVGAQFVVDARQYDEGGWRMPKPIMIVHGSRDETIDPHLSVIYARNNDNATLHMVDDDHSLMTSCTEIWDLLWRDIRPTRQA
jgi:uncharacterized protein